MLSGLLRFENGVVGVLDVNWLTPTKIRELSILGERGMFVVDYLSRELTFFDRDIGFQERTILIRGNVLLWLRGRLTLRLEGNLTRSQAIALAQTVR